MARYAIKHPAYVEDRYFEGPAEITLRDDTVPSRTWTPLDDGAKAALEKLLGKAVEIKPSVVPVVTREPSTMAEMQRPRRAADRNPLG